MTHPDQTETAFDAVAKAYNDATPAEQKQLDRALLMAKARTQASPRGLQAIFPMIARKAPVRIKE